MAAEQRWKYCVAGNIVKTHIDEDGLIRYGTKAFKGGTKVYLCGRIWDWNHGTIVALGLNRFHTYAVNDVPPELIECVRFKITRKPTVLEFMDYYEFKNGWWHDTPEDRESALAFVKRWNEKFTEKRIG